MTTLVAPRPTVTPSTQRRVRIAQFGLGPIGIESLRLAASKPWAEIVGGIDIDPRKFGQKVADVAGLKQNAGEVFSSFDALWQHARPDVILHTAGSKAALSIEQIKPLVRAGVSVVSTCEELLYPQLRAPEAAAELDELCKRNNARVVATGVNPGFVLDVLPVTLTGVSRRVTGIYGERVVNASTRRMPLQKKIGSGMDPDQFRQLFREGKAGHAGFQESAMLIAHALGWPVVTLTETCEPVIADHDITTQYFQVRKGLTCGLHQRVEAAIVTAQTLVLDLKMYLDAQDPHDGVRIDGDPPIDLRINGGVAGDHATVAALINAVPRLLKTEPGLKLMTDLAVPVVS
jgi:4-hydroxy-tetrahydrodipicolinate reductase